MTELAAVQRLSDDILNNVSRVIVGKRDQIALLLTALWAGVHVLLDDVPGTGKTMTAHSFARSMGASFSRIQFTPDLLPSDVTGLNYFNQQTGQFQFRAGPVTANIVLADEINRATPRTQSSLLEAMQERQVTIDGETHVLDRPFMVLATQNPVEMEGTFPLPEAQLDRFGMCLHLGYPSPEEEESILNRFAADDPLNNLEAVASKEQVIDVQEQIRHVYVGKDTTRYIVDLVRSTRERPEILLGASPRASLTLYRCSQALAAIRGRSYVLPDDVRELAGPVLAHRLVLRSRAQLRGQSARELIDHILNTVPVPVERERGPR